MKTNVIRILESKNIVFTTSEYEVDEENLDAISVACKIGVETESVFKTLVTKGDKTGHVVFCIPANFEIDLKKAAKASGNRSIEMIRLKDLFDVTGYIRGGCSPVEMKKQFPTYIDDSVLLFDNIYVSAGIRGMQIKISPENLTKFTDANFVEIT